MKKVKPPPAFHPITGNMEYVLYTYTKHKKVRRCLMELQLKERSKKCLPVVLEMQPTRQSHSH